MSKFQGFGSPQENWSKLPNLLIDALPQIETIGEMKVIIYTLRHTWGYKDDYKKITLDEFENGRKKKDGSRIDNGTGLTKPTIINGIKRAIDHGFLFEYTDTDDPARIKKFYSLTKEGLKDFTPDVKSFYPRGKEILHRTEKETIEKETIVSPNGEIAHPQNNGVTKLTDTQKDELFFFGKHPDSKAPTEQFDTIQEIQATGWDIRNHIVELGIAHYLEAVRTHFPNFAVPNDKGIRNDWYKAVNGHLQDHLVDDLKVLYQKAIDLHRDKELAFSRPGSLTKTLVDLAMAGGVEGSEVVFKI